VGEVGGAVTYVKGYLRRVHKRPPHFTPMSEADKELWYYRIDQIRQGKAKRDVYKHHPLIETAVFLPRFK
jgi:hypothetical protein